MNAQRLLLAATLALGIMETIDIPHTGIPAAVFAVLFFVCAAWLSRRRSMIATTIVTLLFLVEVTQAHTWKDASMAVKVYAMVVGTVGLFAAIGIFIERIRTRRAVDDEGVELPLA
jgi:ABC-type proline/glycine betaine transport system permease subunit